jgi:hypothetical protein
MLAGVLAALPAPPREPAIVAVPGLRTAIAATVATANQKTIIPNGRG